MIKRQSRNVAEELQKLIEDVNPKDPPQKVVKELNKMSEQEMKDWSKLINEVRRQCYQTKNRGKYGNLRRNFKLSELQRFFQVFMPKNVLQAFLIQFFFGLRIGELSQIQYVEDQDLLRVHSTKTDDTSWIPVHGRTKLLMFDLDEIRDYQTGSLQKSFRKIREEAGLDYQYGEATDGRPLHQFTTHSFRHTAITVFANHIDDEYKITEFSRHKAKNQLGTVATYRHYEQQKLRTDLENAFDDWYKLIDIALEDTGNKRHQCGNENHLPDEHKRRSKEEMQTYRKKSRRAVQEKVKEHRNTIRERLSTLNLPKKIGEAFKLIEDEYSYKTFQRRIRNLAEKNKIETTRKCGKGGNTTVIKEVKP